MTTYSVRARVCSLVVLLYNSCIVAYRGLPACVLPC